MTRTPGSTSICATLAALSLLCRATGIAAADEADVVYGLAGIDLLGRGPHYLDLGVGVFDLREAKDTSRRSAAGRIEFRIGEKLHGIGPALGLMANADGGVHGYGAVYADLRYRNWVLTPLAELGGYAKGDGSDLGGVFQFRLGIGIARQFPDLSRLGLRLAHISNAGIHRRNPGEEELYLTYALPF